MATAPVRQGCRGPSTGALDLLSNLTAQLPDSWAHRSPQTRLHEAPLLAIHTLLEPVGASNDALAGSLARPGEARLPTSFTNMMPSLASPGAAPSMLMSLAAGGPVATSNTSLGLGGLQPHWSQSLSGVTGALPRGVNGMGSHEQLNLAVDSGTKQQPRGGPAMSTGTMPLSKVNQHGMEAEGAGGRAYMAAGGSYGAAGGRMVSADGHDMHQQNGMSHHQGAVDKMDSGLRGGGVGGRSGTSREQVPLNMHTLPSDNLMPDAYDGMMHPHVLLSHPHCATLLAIKLGLNSTYQMAAFKAAGILRQMLGMAMCNPGLLAEVAAEAAALEEANAAEDLLGQQGLELHLAPEDITHPHAPPGAWLHASQPQAVQPSCNMGSDYAVGAGTSRPAVRLGSGSFKLSGGGMAHHHPIQSSQGQQLQPQQRPPVSSLHAAQANSGQHVPESREDGATPFIFGGMLLRRHSEGTGPVTALLPTKLGAVDVRARTEGGAAAGQGPSNSLLNVSGRVSKRPRHHSFNDGREVSSCGLLGEVAADLPPSYGPGGGLNSNPGSPAASRAASTGLSGRPRRASAGRKYAEYMAKGEGVGGWREQPGGATEGVDSMEVEAMQALCEMGSRGVSPSSQALKGQVGHCRHVHAPPPLLQSSGQQLFMGQLAPFVSQVQSHFPASYGVQSPHYPNPQWPPLHSNNSVGGWPDLGLGGASAGAWSEEPYATRGSWLDTALPQGGQDIISHLAPVAQSAGPLPCSSSAAELMLHSPRVLDTIGCQKTETRRQVS